MTILLLLYLMVLDGISNKFVPITATNRWKSPTILDFTGVEGDFGVKNSNNFCKMLFSRKTCFQPLQLLRFKV